MTDEKLTLAADTERLTDIVRSMSADEETLALGYIRGVKDGMTLAEKKEGKRYGK